MASEKIRAVAGDKPVIILVRPQLDDNIGSVARAMLNCELTELRLVQPREGKPGERAYAMSAGGDIVLDQAKCYESLADAAFDLHYLCAATARIRDMNIAQLPPEDLPAKASAYIAAGHRVGFVFGPERTGLENEDLALVDEVISFTLNPTFKSLNLAQTVLLVAHDWYRFVLRDLPPISLEKLQNTSKDRLVDKKELDNFHRRLETALDAVGYFQTPELKPRHFLSIKSIFSSATLTHQEIQTLHGIVSLISQDKRKG